MTSFLDMTYVFKCKTFSFGTLIPEPGVEAIDCHVCTAVGCSDPFNSNDIAVSTTTCSSGTCIKTKTEGSKTFITCYITLFPPLNINVQFTEKTGHVTKSTNRQEEHNVILSNYSTQSIRHKTRKQSTDTYGILSFNY